jgi:hypothetical protein
LLVRKGVWRMRCEHGFAARGTAIDVLPQSQAGGARHKCAVCAYAAGYTDALEYAYGRIQRELDALMLCVRTQVASEGSAHGIPDMSGWGRAVREATAILLREGVAPREALDLAVAGMDAEQRDG